MDKNKVVSIGKLFLKEIKQVKNIPLGWAWLIVSIACIVFSFYWFSVRPANIQHKCYMYPYPSYNECLVKNGLAI
jgi:hypothetical protein